VKIFDMHVHLRDDESFRHTLALERRAGAVKIAVSCLEPMDGIYKPTPKQFRANNARVHEWMRREEGFVEGWAYVNPLHLKESLEEIERARDEYGMVGVKLECGAVCTDLRAEAVVEKAASLGMPVLHHCWFKITGCIPGESIPEDVATLAGDIPEASIVMAHIGGDWQRGIKAVRDLSNVLVDTSGSIAESGMIETAVAELGAERVLFGTDLPDIDLWTNLGKIESAGITRREKEIILYENAAKLLGHRRSPP